MSSMEQLYQSIQHKNSRDHIETALHIYAASFKDHDIEKRSQLFADNARFEDPANAPAFNGLAAIQQLWQGLKAAPYSLEPEVHQVVICGDSALLDFTMHMKAQSESRSLHVRDIFEFDEQGKISSLKAFWDPSCLNEES